LIRCNYRNQSTTIMKAPAADRTKRFSPRTGLRRLADPGRCAILAALGSGGPATATDLAGRLPITRQAIVGFFCKSACLSSRRTDL